jgi:hypothetical protein
MPDTPAIDWHIQGERGELRLTSPSMTLNVGRDETKIEFYDVETGKTEVLEVEKDEWSGFPRPMQNIGRLYEAWRLGEWVPDFEWGIKRHAMIDEMWKSYDESLNA